MGDTAMQTTRKLAALTAAAAALIIWGRCSSSRLCGSRKAPPLCISRRLWPRRRRPPPPAIININTATAEELTTLPGLGPEKAAALVAYRTAHGAFASLADAANVKGISLRMTESWAGLAAVQ